MAWKEVAYFCHLKCEPLPRKSDEAMEIKEVLEQFSSIFTEPEGLPPNRTIDHHIELEEGA